MEQYEKIEIEVIRFETADILTNGDGSDDITGPEV